MIAGQENRWNFPAFPDRWPSIMRVLQKVSLEALQFQRIGVAGDTGQQADTRLDQRLGCDLPSGQNEIPDRDLLKLPSLDDPLVQPLKPAAQQDNARASCKIPDACLR